MATSSLVGLAVLVGIVLTALLRAGRSPHPQHLHFHPKNVVMLEHLCRETGAMLRDASAPQTVTLDLSALAVLGASSLGSLEYACSRWTRAGTRVTFKGCRPHVAAALWRRSVPADIEFPDFVPSTMLH